MKTVTVYLYAPGSRNDAIRTFSGVPYMSTHRGYECFQFKTKEGLTVHTSLEYIMQEEPSEVPQ